MSKKKRFIYTKENIKLAIEERDFELIEILKFQNIKSSVIIQCKKCKHVFKRRVEQFKDNPTCPNCRINTRVIPYEKLKEFIEVDSNSYCKLLTTEEEYYEIKKKNLKSSMCKFKYKCKCGNEFETSLSNFKASKIKGCRKCASKSIGLNLKLTYENVKKYVEEDSNSNCILLSTEYVEYHAPLLFKCECGNKFTRALSEFKGRNLFKCRNCAGAVKVYTYEEIKKELEDNNIKLYSNEYINNQQKLVIECDKGHVTHRTIENIRKSEYTCPKCNNVGYKRNTEQLKSEIKIATKGKYELLSEYKTMNDVVLIKHIECNTKWQTTPHNFLDGGNRCPICKKSKGELKIKEYLEMNNINYKMEYSFDDLKGDYDFLRFDFAIFDKENNLKLLIEYDGEFHYSPIMGESNLLRQQDYDNRKNNYCRKKRIKLVRIPYWEFNNLEGLLDKLNIKINKEE